MDKKAIAGRIKHAIKKGNIEKALSTGLNEIEKEDPFYDFLRPCCTAKC